MAIKPTYEELEQRIKELESRLEQREETLRLSVERNRLATSAAKVGVWDWNIKTGDFYLDPNIKAILGYSDDEIPNDIEIWVKYVHPEDSKPVMEAAQECLDGKTSEFIFEHRMFHKDGSIRWILVHGKAIRDESGNAIRLVGTDVDITDRKKAENALRESESRYRAFFEKGPDGVVILDIETTRPIEFNDQACQQLSYSREEFAQLRIPDIEVKETAKEAREHIRKVVNKGYDDFETLQRTKKGEIRNVHVTAQLLEIMGNPVYHCIWRDITERKRTEEALRDSQHMLQTVLDSVPSGVFWKDRDSNYIGANRAFLEAVGLKSSEHIVGKSDYDLLWEKEQANSFRDHDKSVMESDIPKYCII